MDRTPTTPDRGPQDLDPTILREMDDQSRRTALATQRRLRDFGLGVFPREAELRQDQPSSMALAWAAVRYVRQVDRYVAGSIDSDGLTEARRDLVSALDRSQGMGVGSE